MPPQRRRRPQGSCHCHPYDERGSMNRWQQRKSFERKGDVASCVQYSNSFINSGFHFSHIPFVASSSRPSNCLNINGIIYKSSKLKLQKTDAPISLPSPKATTSAASKFVPAHRRLIIVRGENFLLDANGTNLVRMGSTQSPSATETAIKRIDIGRITFVQKSNNTFERTDYHKNRFHLNAAKQRSINLLTSKLAKSNVPCPIYRKLGKCAAFDRGKCSKLHDPKQVDICQK